MARIKNYKALIELKQNEIQKTKEKLSLLEKELKELKEEQKALEISRLYEAVKQSGKSIDEVIDLLKNK